MRCFVWQIEGRSSIMKLWVCKKRDGMEWMGVPQVLWRSTLLSWGTSNLRSTARRGSVRSISRPFFFSIFSIFFVVFRFWKFFYKRNFGERKFFDEKFWRPKKIFKQKKESRKKFQEKKLESRKN